jgi:hypothetical protein
MAPENHNNALTAETGKRGGLKRAEQQSAEERSALARYAARARWHPQELAYLIKQALNGKQLPLV